MDVSNASCLRFFQRRTLERDYLSVYVQILDFVGFNGTNAALLMPMCSRAADLEVNEDCLNWFHRQAVAQWRNANSDRQLPHLWTGTLYIVRSMKTEFRNLIQGLRQISFEFQTFPVCFTVCLFWQTYQSSSLLLWRIFSRWRWHGNWPVCQCPALATPAIWFSGLSIISAITNKSTISSKDPKCLVQIMTFSELIKYYSVQVLYDVNFSAVNKDFDVEHASNVIQRRFWVKCWPLPWQLLVPSKGREVRQGLLARGNERVVVCL